MAKTDWVDTDGTIVDIDNGRWSKGAVFTCEVGGSSYSGTYMPSEAVQEGDGITVRYDSANPEHNDLVDKWVRRKWMIVIGIGVVIAIAIVCFMN